MHINRALLKYGYDNFEFSILEFCNKDQLIEKELYYFNLYNPEYNILKIPGSPSRGSGWNHSIETINKMSEAALLRNQKPGYLEKQYVAQSTNIKVTLIDLLDNKVEVFNSIKGTARALNIDHRIINNYIYLNKSKPYLGRYQFIIDKSNITNKSIVQKKS